MPKYSFMIVPHNWETRSASQIPCSNLVLSSEKALHESLVQSMVGFIKQKLELRNNPDRHPLRGALGANPSDDYILASIRNWPFCTIWELREFSLTEVKKGLSQHRGPIKYSSDNNPYLDKARTDPRVTSLLSLLEL